MRTTTAIVVAACLCVCIGVEADDERAMFGTGDFREGVWQHSIVNRSSLQEVNVIATRSCVPVGVAGRDGSYGVWILDNLDPDFRNPPFDDRLRVATDGGKVVVDEGGFGICQGVGAWRALDVSPEGDYALVAEFCRSYDGADLITKVDISGSRIWSKPFPETWAVDISTDGFAYATADTTTSGTELIVLDPEDGSIVRSAPISGVDLVVDDLRDAIWMVGHGIKRVNRATLEVEWVLERPYTADVSVDLASDGSAWVAARTNFPNGEMVHVSTTGEILNNVWLPAHPSSLSVDAFEDSVWVTIFWDRFLLNKYDSSENLLFSIPSPGRPWSVRVNPSDGSAWVAERDGTVRHFSRSGELLNVIPGPPGDPLRDAWIALGPASPQLDPVDLVRKILEQFFFLGLRHGIENSLTSKLNNALRKLTDVDRWNDHAAVNILGAFINQVEAQRGKAISEADADELISSAQEIIGLVAAEGSSGPDCSLPALSISTANKESPFPDTAATKARGGSSLWGRPSRLGDGQTGERE
jgi:hypothetical protein